jgi:hypothetical protein
MHRVLLLSMLAILCDCRSVRAHPSALPVRVATTAKPAESIAESEVQPKTRPAPDASSSKRTAEVPKKQALRKVQKPLLNPYEASAFFDHQDSEHKRFGIARYAKSQRKKKYGNTVVMQRSGRKRLYDHNILLRALFAGQLHSEVYGDLSEQFTGGIFFDLGSAILFGEGAETVRDLHEDEAIRRHLTIIASDINDPGGRKSMFVEQYRESDEQLPFPVVEIPRLMDKPEHFARPLRLFLNNESGIILRSANSGPDLYYDTNQVKRHLRAAIEAFYDRNVLYLFNKFILYKPATRLDFLLIGEIDETVGINHKQPAWEEIDWSKRTFAEAVRLNTQHVTFRP